MSRPKSQAALEALLVERWPLFEEGGATVAEAFGDGSLWELELGERRLRLVPYLRRWHVFNRLDRWWDDLGLAPSRALLVPLDGGLMAKRLPAPSSVQGWAVYQVGDSVRGPMRLDELSLLVASRQVGTSVPVWTADDVVWRPAAETLAAMSAALGSAPDAAQARFCHHCGAPLGGQARFCVRCGTARL